MFANGGDFGVTPGELLASGNRSAMRQSGLGTVFLHLSVATFVLCTSKFSKGRGALLSESAPSYCTWRRFEVNVDDAVN